MAEKKKSTEKESTKTSAKSKEQTVEELTAKVEDSAKEIIEENNVAEAVKDVEEEIKVKSKDKKKLTETELKKVMTDTKETLVPLTDYIRCSVHLGTKVITPDMKKFVYKRRADGLAVMNTLLIDEKLREGIEFLNSFDAKDIFITCKREAAWPAVEKFAEMTGIRAFTKKYPAGIITNTQLDDFFEAKLVIVCDPWVDKNALNDAMKLKMEILGVADTNNYTKGITQKIIGNNKSGKSLGLILYVLTREYLKAKGQDKEAKALNLEDFTGKLEDVREDK